MMERRKKHKCPKCNQDYIKGETYIVRQGDMQCSYCGKFVQ